MAYLLGIDIGTSGTKVLAIDESGKIAATASAEMPQPAVLTVDITFKPQLTHFVPVRLTVDAEGRRLATPLRVGGSGDMMGLVGANAFLELPPEPVVVAAGSVWPAWAL